MVGIKGILIIHEVNDILHIVDYIREIKIATVNYSIHTNQEMSSGLLKTPPAPIPIITIIINAKTSRTVPLIPMLV